MRCVVVVMVTGNPIRSKVVEGHTGVVCHQRKIECILYSLYTYLLILFILNKLELPYYNGLLHVFRIDI